MDQSPPSLRIGEILTQCGLATHADVERALDLARRDNIRLGEALIRLGVINQDKVTWALGVQFALSYVDLDEDMIDWEFLLSLPLDELRRAMLLPIAVINDRVHAVVADPTDREALLQTIERIFGSREVIIQLASPEEITSTFNEAVVRKVDPARVRRPPGWEVGLLGGWLEHLELGSCSRIAILPEPQGHGLYRVASEPVRDGVGRSLTDGDLASISMMIATQCSSESSFQSGWSGMRAARGFGAHRAVRAIMLAGPAGRMIGMESIGNSPPPPPTSKPCVILGGDPISAKHDLYTRAASVPGALAVEVRTDFSSDAIFQTEITDPDQRRAAALLAASALHPGILIYECGTLAELSQLVAERLVNGRWIILVRATGGEPSAMSPLGEIEKGDPARLGEILQKAGACAW